MAEERFMDDDKDRKYRIRKNEFGEEELEILDPGEDEPEEEIDYGANFEVPEFSEDDESAALMTPEQLFAERKRKEEERQAASAEASALVEKAKTLAAEGDAEYALITLDSAQKTFSEQWEIYPMKLELLTKNFTDFSRVDECLSLTENYVKYVPAENRALYSEKYAGKVLSEAERVKAANSVVQRENEEKKAERRVRFKERFKIALRNFLLAVVPFIVLLCVGIGFSTVMYSEQGGSMLVVTAVFFSLAAVALIASIVLARPLAAAVRHMRVNENDNSTALGRTYMEGAEMGRKLDELYSAILYPQSGEKVG